MTEQQKKGAVEAILFASGEPIAPNKIAEAAELSVSETIALLTALSLEYREAERGMRIVVLDGEYQMCSSKEYAKAVRTALELRRNTPLSAAAMEVLAVVAYNQPVTKSFLEQVRGVDCSGVVSSLMAKGLLEERGRLELPGRPLLYGTTQNFLRCMNISSLEELPPLPEEEGQDGEEAEADDEQNEVGTT
jgi:segregation and condensation protein B